MHDIASWIATVATIFAACLTASNLGTRITGIGFIVFTVGSIAWAAVGLLGDQPALIWTNVVMTGLNLFGVWRWLGRQAKLEEGAQRAAEASVAKEGATLFPVSLLLRAAVATKRGANLGACVDGMAECERGRIDYLVVSSGGVGGVGETVRRLPWSEVAVDGERLVCRLDQSTFERLPQVEKDDWR